MKKQFCMIWCMLCILLYTLTGCVGFVGGGSIEFDSESSAIFTLETVPTYTGQPYIAINDNMPYFTEEDLTTESFETYVPLDNLGRCVEAYANVGQDLMPTEERESISSVKPSGWQSVQYDFVSGKSLYNRCHLIGFQLTGENANKENLITGTRYLNIEGMLPFEDLIADYVKETNHHVLYRVTPIFTGENLVADGVLMEGYSVEDEGEGVCFCVYAYNVQPGVEIDYATGKSKVAETTQTTDTSQQEQQTYILNTNSKKFHLPSCSSVKSMSENNKKEYIGTRETLLEQGYESCGQCKS